MNFNIDGVLFKKYGKFVQGQYNSIRAWELGWPEEVRKWRGHIYDTDLNKFVARPFEKFFKLEDPYGVSEEDFKKFVDDESYDIKLAKKLDGTLMILWNCDSVPTISTKRMINFDKNLHYSLPINFHKVSYEFLEDYNFSVLYKEPWFKKFTFMFELIDTDNRIITKYDLKDEGLYLIAMRETSSGLYLPENSSIINTITDKTGVPIIRGLDFTRETLLDDLLKYKRTNDNFFPAAFKKFYRSFNFRAHIPFGKMSGVQIITRFFHSHHIQILLLRFSKIQRYFVH